MDDKQREHILQFMNDKSWDSKKMRKWLDDLLSEFHRRVMKPRGFRKKGRTFLRENDNYSECYNIQASSWNGPWGCCFYVNVGLFFKHVESPKWALLWSGTDVHWTGRIEQITGSDFTEYRYDHKTIDANGISRRLEKDILITLDTVSKDWRRFRQVYLQRLESIRHLQR